MEPKAIDPVDFREAQHKHWDAAAVGWKAWSEFDDSADGHISERLLKSRKPWSRSRRSAAGTSGWGGIEAKRSVSSAPSASLVAIPRVAASIRRTAPPMSVNGT